jgi:hypothetical protein
MTLYKEAFDTINGSLSVTMGRYTRYYVNQSGGGSEIGPVYRTSFRVQRGTVQGPSSGDSSVLLNLCCIQGQRL